MDEQTTETRETGFGRNLMESTKGAVGGLILFLASFVVLWINEGRTDISQVMQTSIPISAETVDHASNGKFVSVTGKLESTESAGDPWYVKFGPYIALKRRVEMYAWVEHETTDTRRKTISRRKVAETTYSYDKDWTDNPQDSRSFHEQKGHMNPSASVESITFTVNTATVGEYNINPKSASLPCPTPVQITRENFIPSLRARLRGDYIFIGRGTLQDPKLGDLRLSYSAFKPGTPATVFGKLNGDSIEPYIYKDNKELYRAIAGSRDEAIARMSSGHRASAWIFRGIGFTMMWIGLCLFFKPANAAVDFAPALREVGRSVVSIAMFPMALGLSLITVIVSSMTHNVLLLIACVVVVLIAIWVPGRIRSKREETKPSPRKGDTLSLKDGDFVRRETSKEETTQEAKEKEGIISQKIRFECEECGARYAVPASLGGRKVKCKNCDHKFYVPTESISQEEANKITDSAPQRNAPEDAE